MRLRKRRKPLWKSRSQGQAAIDPSSFVPLVVEALIPVIRETIVRELRHERRVEAKEGLNSLAQAATFLGMDPRTVTFHRKAGRLRAILLPGAKQWRFDLADLQRFKNSGPRF